MTTMFELSEKVNWPESRFMAEDLTFVRKRISNSRASNTQTLTLFESRHYDGAKTITGVLEYILMAGLDITANQFSIQLDPHTETKIVALGTIAGQPAKMTLSYSCNYEAKDKDHLNIYDNKPDGYFKIVIEPERDDAPWHRFTVGNSTLQDIAKDTSDTDLIYPVNRNSNIGFAENFPMPSVFIEALSQAWKNAFDDVPKSTEGGNVNE